MKLMIASDIHGSAVYCEKLLERFEAENPDMLLLLGDILYHGPRNDLPDGYDPKKVADMLNNIKKSIMCVRGNCDAEVDQMMLDFPIMADYCALSVDGVNILATHGHIYNEDQLPPMPNVDVLLNGHTHIPKCVKHTEYTYVNPGSVSIPKEGSERGYAIFEDSEFVWKNLKGETVEIKTEG